MLVLGENTPADNIMAETILGLHDHLRRRAPNTSNRYMAADRVQSEVQLLSDLKIQIQTEALNCCSQVSKL